MSELSTVRMRIQWHDDKSEAVKTFALIPNDWKGKELSNHPADGEVFYWLEPAEWLTLGAGETYADFDVIDCACEECEYDRAESEAYNKAEELEGATL